MPLEHASVEVSHQTTQHLLLLASHAPTPEITRRSVIIQPVVKHHAAVPQA